MAKHFGFIWARKICERTFPLLLYCAMALSRFNCMWWASRVLWNYMYISFALLLPSTQCLFSVFGVYCVCSFFGCALVRLTESIANRKEKHTRPTNQRKKECHYDSFHTDTFQVLLRKRHSSSPSHFQNVQISAFFPEHEDSLWLVDDENERESALRTHAFPHNSKLPQQQKNNNHTLFQFCPSKKYH